MGVSQVSSTEILAAALPLFSALITAGVGLYLKGRIQEVHVMVNARLEKVTALLATALADNVRLKDAAGEPPGPPQPGTGPSTGT